MSAHFFFGATIFAIACLAATGVAQNSESDPYVNRPYDYVVIGSGISGLAAANKLVDYNKKVLVLEQHYKAGGCTHTFSRHVTINGTSYHPKFDSGFHAYTDMLNMELMSDLYGENVHFSWPPEYARDVVFVEDRRYDVPNGGNESYVNWLMDTFPEDADGIRALVRQMKALRGTARRAVGRAAWDVLPEVTKASILEQEASMVQVKTELNQYPSYEAYLDAAFINNDLRMLLAGTVCECSGLPPMYMPADAGVDTLAMFAEGFTFPIEGPQKLAEVMVERLATRGGEIRTNSKVVKILLDTEPRGVRGVKLESGEEIEVRNVISSVGIDQTRALITDPGVEIPNMKHAPNPMYHSMSAFLTYLVFDKSARDLDLVPYFITMPMSLMPAVLDDMSSAAIVQMRAPLLGFEKSLRTTAFNATGADPPAVLELFTATFWWEWLQYGGAPGDRSPDYLAHKQQLQNAQLATLYNYFPATLGHVVLAESATPKTIEHYVQKTHGAALGYIGLTDDDKPPFATGIAGLTFCGCDITTSLGNALATGAEAAGVAMRNTNVIKELGGLIWPNGEM